MDGQGTHMHMDEPTARAPRDGCASLRTSVFGLLLLSGARNAAYVGCPHAAPRASYQTAAEVSIAMAGSMEAGQAVPKAG